MGSWGLQCKDCIFRFTFNKEFHCCTRFYKELFCINRRSCKSALFNGNPKDKEIADDLRKK